MGHREGTKVPWAENCYYYEPSAQPGHPGRPQAALSGHQLPLPLPAAHRQRLKHTQLLDGAGQLLQRRLVKGPPGLAGVGLNGVQGEEQHPPALK